ncbi:unnamed protein product [Symbiodinium pilosum]|uniref:Uncharacterized protein n=1 Tax=Symbiodinium pilosum TaxID=2952 RepID=A0A812QH51_SYMPI|nr:unnamed protein product [Symbiodinium pilosum]
MLTRPESIEEWCYLVPHLLSQNGWQTVQQTPSSAVLHCSCPWGGSLVKASFWDLLLIDPPDDPAYVLCRPETRAWSWQVQPELSGESIQDLCVVAPGNCTLHWWVDWKMMPLWDVLFGCGRQLGQWKLGHASLRRNYPEKGDCSLAMFDCFKPMQRLTHSRPDKDGKYSVCVILAIPEGFHYRNWEAPHVHLALDLFRSTALWYLNRPGIQMERFQDQAMYVVLTITSFKHGRLLLPDATHEAKHTTKIDRGQDFGLSTWVRYHPSMSGSRCFSFSEYLGLFLERLGEPACTYQSLDGQDLLPYQCVMARSDWCRVRDRFQEAFTLQKSAYRRANGGTAAPRVTEGAQPRFCREARLPAPLWSQLDPVSSCGLVVHNTFLEIDESDGDTDEAVGRTRTTSPARSRCEVMAA